tara:strand:+ start:15747 stop:17237 length:1491 start_codon:yes stop_codon:yes gene_type:complete
MSDFVPTFWNTLTQFNGKSRTSKVSAGQVAYKKSGYAWGNIITDVESDFTATKFPGSIQFPRNAQDWLDAEFNGEYSAKRQITEGNWSNSEDAFVMRMKADCPTNATGIIHPDKPWQVIYYNAFGQGQNLIYGHWHGKTSRLEHVIEITELPPGDSEYLTYDFYIQSNDATTFVGENFGQRPWAGNSGDGATVQGFSVFLAKGDDHTTIRGAVLRKPVCWWANLDGTTTIKDVRVDVVIQPDRRTVKATKYIRRSDVVEALSQGSPYRADVTFNPDPSPETTSVDGVVKGSSTGSWATIVNGVADYASDSDASSRVMAEATASSNVYSQLRKLFFLFDTSSIGTGQQVDSATFGSRLDNQRSIGTMGLSTNIYSSSPASNTAITTADYLQVGSTPFTDSPRLMSAESFDNPFVTQTLNAAGRAAIAMEGITKLAMSVVEAQESGSPTWASNNSAILAVNMAETSGTANDPTLTFTYSAAGPAVAVLAHHKKLSLRY